VAVLRVWWHAVAWYRGIAAAGLDGPVAALAEGLPAAVRALRDAAAVASGRPDAAYTLLWDRLGGGAAVEADRGAGWGVGALTAFLYFVGGGCQNHPCLVLDGEIARALVRCGGWESLPADGWSGATYGRYCRLVRRWAVEETARRHRLVYPDQIERWLATAA
jgi:hypothetical protein